MYEKALQEIGLTRNESAVYLQLLQLGRAKSGQIVKAAKISSGKIYETLYKLVEKGLVKEVSENGIKHFIANDPKMLISYVKDQEEKLVQKEQELKDILPMLEQYKSSTLKMDSVSLIKGFRGISTVVYSALEQGREIKIMGIRSSKDEKFNSFWRKWHNYRISLKKNAQILFSDKDTPYWEHFQKLKYTQTKAITLFSPSAVMIIDNNVFIFSYEEEFTCIHILLPPIAKSFNSFFDGLWNYS